MREFLEKQLDQFWKNFQVILVSNLFLACVAAAVYIHTRPAGSMDEGTLDWARTLSFNLLSLLGGLVGGIQIGKAMVPSGTTSTTISHTEPEPTEPPRA
jgi:hypothetical protein